MLPKTNSKLIALRRFFIFFSPLSGAGGREPNSRSNSVSVIFNVRQSEGQLSFHPVELWFAPLLRARPLAPEY
jgi:hypothetical protein